MSVLLGTTDDSTSEELLSIIEEELKNGGEGSERIDTFKTFFETTFGDSIETIEIVESSVDEDELVDYQESVDRLVHMFDTYFGIIPDMEYSTNIDLDFIHSLYNIFYNKFIYYFSQYIYGALIVKYNTVENIKEELKKAMESGNYDDEADFLINPFIQDEDSFEFENFVGYISTVDHGNADITRLLSFIKKMMVNYDNVAIRRRMAKEVSDQANEIAIVTLVHTFIDNASKEKTDEQ